MIDRRTTLLGLAALTAGCGAGGALGRLAAGERAKVAEVRSGEVLILDNGLEVRLAGVEGPNGAEPLADTAKSSLTTLAMGREVLLRYGGLRRDRYDRALAQIECGRRWLQGELLTRGLARVRTYADNRAMAAEMLELEARARVAGKGLWAVAEYRVLLPQECRGKSGFQIVEGTVATTSVGRLELLGGVAVAIAGPAVEAFRAAGKGPGALKDQLVRARGTLRGGVLRVDHPEQVEVLGT